MCAEETIQGHSGTVAVLAGWEFTSGGQCRETLCAPSVGNGDGHTFANTYQHLLSQSV